MTKYIITIILISYTHILFAQSFSSKPFFNLKEDKSLPNILLSNIISTNAMETNGSFSPDGTMFLYTVEWLWAGGTIVYLQLIDGNWTLPEIVPFSGKYPDIDPIFSPDGKRIYFTSKRPLDGIPTDRNDTNLWYVEVLDSGFSIPKHVGLSINTEENQYYNSSSRKGSIFFHSINEDSNSNDIFQADWNGKEYIVTLLDSTINSSYSDSDPFISPDEDYMIFTSNRPGGYGSNDLYISFYKDDKWGKPINLGGDINTSNNEYAPCVSSGILTYTSNRMIEGWNTNHKESYRTLMAKINKSDNQLNNIWFVNFDFNTIIEK